MLMPASAEHSSAMSSASPQTTAVPLNAALHSSNMQSLKMPCTRRFPSATMQSYPNNASRKVH
jgi:hypothetical protein